MANDTGGRFTRGTNDLSLGYARARRDLGCRYTVGFYVNRIKKDKARSIRLRVKIAGLEVRYPGQYKAQSQEKIENTRLMAAFLQPEMFQADYLRTHLFLLQPRTPGSWDALVAVNFPVVFPDPENPSYQGDFGVVVSNGAQPIYHFNRSVSIRPKQGVALEERRFTFLEPVVVRPGTFFISTVVNETGSKAPAAVRVAVEVPAIPWQELTLVSPILGRPRGRNVLIRGGGPEDSRGRFSSSELAQYDIHAGQGTFEPLLVLQAEQHETVLSRNKACLIGAKRMNLPEGTLVDRTLVQENENRIEMHPFPLSLEEGRKVRCRNIFEVLDHKDAVEGLYTYEVLIDKSGKFEEVQRHLPLAIEAGKAQNGEAAQK